jgi:hypothetical protein
VRRRVVAQLVLAREAEQVLDAREVLLGVVRVTALARVGERDAQRLRGPRLGDDDAPARPRIERLAHAVAGGKRIRGMVAASAVPRPAVARKAAREADCAGSLPRLSP